MPKARRPVRPPHFAWGQSERGTGLCQRDVSGLCAFARCRRGVLCDDPGDQRRHPMQMSRTTRVLIGPVRWFGNSPP